ncbi:mucin-13 isoform X2 [Hyla sarda]|uniref:mucin-13 isoform X2 n=1 Tax=Hyla sarda TaxID=327740 RepID=UPI0024C2509B|nr:mucin-13 isoform X2 [Hyla sarda]
MRGVIGFCLIILVIPGLEVSGSTVQPATTTNVNSTTSANSTTVNPIVTTGNTTENVNSTGNANVTTQSPIVTVNTTENVNSTANANVTTANPIVTGSTTENVNSTASANSTTASLIVTGNTTENVNSTESANVTTANPIVTGNTTENVNSTENTIGPVSTPMMTTTKPITCSSGVCGIGSTCLQLYQTYECQCPLNYRYNATDRTCLRGESFYGDFLIQGVSFNEKPESMEYTELYNRVITMSEASLSDLEGYLGTVIVKISAVSSKSKTRSRRSNVDVTAKVSQIFSQGTKRTAEEVIAAIESKYPGAYNNQSICTFICDLTTTTCEPTPDGQGATCTCLEGYYSSSTATVTTCRDCSPQCYLEEKKYCNQGSEPMPSCDCRPGYKTNGDTCQECDFGYSGADCKDTLRKQRNMKTEQR